MTASEQAHTNLILSLKYAKTLQKCPLNLAMCQQQSVNLDLGGCVNYQTANAAEIIEASFGDVSKSGIIGGGSHLGHESFRLT